MPQTCGNDDDSGSDTYDSGTNDLKFFMQLKLIDLVRYSDLPKDLAKVLVFRLKEKNVCSCYFLLLVLEQRKGVCSVFLKRVNLFSTKICSDS